MTLSDMTALEIPVGSNKDRTLSARHLAGTQVVPATPLHSCLGKSPPTDA